MVGFVCCFVFLRWFLIVFLIGQMGEDVIKSRSVFDNYVYVLAEYIGVQMLFERRINP